MARQLSAWNKFVKSVFQSEKKKNPKCTFAEALKKASQLKKSGKMKGGLVTNEGDSGLTDSGLTDSGLSNSGDVSSSSTPFSASGMTTPQNTPVTSSLMSGGKTRKRKSGKSKKSKKSRKSRKSRKSKK